MSVSQKEVFQLKDRIHTARKLAQMEAHYGEPLKGLREFVRTASSELAAVCGDKERWDAVFSAIQNCDDLWRGYPDFVELWPMALTELRIRVEPILDAHRGAVETSSPRAPADSSASPSGRSRRKSRVYLDETHRLHVELSDSVLDKMKMDSFLYDHPNVTRTAFTSYRRGQIGPRKMSGEKRSEVETAIRESATALNLDFPLGLTRTS